MWERKDDESPCRACMVVLEEPNIDVMKVYLAVQHHVILHEVSKDKTLLDLDVKAVDAAMEIYQVKEADRARCYERVRGLFFHMSQESGE